jgi:hypothetical protein
MNNFCIKSLWFQWAFQDPKMEVLTIYKAYFSGLCKGISPENNPEIPIDDRSFHTQMSGSY